MKSKKWIYILAGIVIILIVFAIVKKKGSSNGIEVSAEKVEKRTIIETVAASGKIQPETEVVISSDVSGEIIELAVKEGQIVTKGDLLVKIDPDLVESALSRAEASLNTSKANYSGAKARLAQSESQFENAKAIFERNKTLFKDNVISQSEFDQAKANYEVADSEVSAAKENVEAARFNVKSSEATLKEAKENLGRTSIYAPIDGVITALNLEKGERVVGTAQMTGTEIMTVADLTIMEVAVEVNENDIVRVSIGDTSEIEVDAYLDSKFKGIVTEIANSANINGVSADQVTNFDVKIRMLASSYKDLIKEVGNSISPFRPGMSANADIRTNYRNDIIAVPIQAVTTRKDTSLAENDDENLEDDEDIKKECVFVVKDNKAKVVFVKTGIQNTMYIEVVEGIEEGETVVTSPYSAVSRKLKNNSTIEVVDKKDLFKKDKEK